MRADGDAHADAAARAALDAYMRDSLGLVFEAPAARAVPKPRPKHEPKPVERARDAAEDGDTTASSDGEGQETDTTTKDSKPRKPDTTAFSFRLFAGSGRAKTATAGTAGSQPRTGVEPESPAATPVVLLDDLGEPTGSFFLDGTFAGAAAAGAAGLLGAPRPLSFYLAGEPTAAERARYAQAAVEGAAVRAQAALDGPHRAWGWEVPWRARTVVRVPAGALRALLGNALPAGQTVPGDLPRALAAAANALPLWAGGVPGGAAAQEDAADAAAGQSSRRRPGKRRRIILRKRALARRDAETATAAKLVEKEEHLSEKKKRLNRLKKRRRREKRRAGKGEGGGGDDAGSNASAGESDGD